MKGYSNIGTVDFVCINFHGFILSWIFGFQIQEKWYPMNYNEHTIQDLISRIIEHIK